MSILFLRIRFWWISKLLIVIVYRHVRGWIVGRLANLFYNSEKNSYQFGQIWENLDLDKIKKKNFRKLRKKPSSPNKKNGDVLDFCGLLQFLQKIASLFFFVFSSKKSGVEAWPRAVIDSKTFETRMFSQGIGSINIVAIVWVRSYCVVVHHMPYYHMSSYKMKWKCHEANERMCKIETQKVLFCSFFCFVDCLLLTQSDQSNHNNKETIWLLIGIWTNRLRRISISPTHRTRFRDLCD